MANKKRGEVKLELGGRQRILKLTLNDFAELQDMYNNKPLMEVLSSLDKMDVKLLRTLLYLSMRHDDKDLTEEQVGNFEFSLAEAAQKLGECIAASLGQSSSGK